jgi:hypothetical protein
LPAQNFSRRYPVQFVKISADALLPLNRVCRHSRKPQNN